MCIKLCQKIDNGMQNSLELLYAVYLVLFSLTLRFCHIFHYWVTMDEFWLKVWELYVLFYPPFILRVDFTTQFWQQFELMAVGDISKIYQRWIILLFIGSDQHLVLWPLITFLRCGKRDIQKRIRKRKLIEWRLNYTTPH